MTTATPDGHPARWLARVGPVLLALFAVAGTFGAAERQPERRDLDVLAVILVLAGPVALLWLRRRPVTVLWTVTGATAAYLLLDYPYGPVMIAMVVATVGAVVTGHRLWAWAAAATLLVAHFGLAGLTRDEPWSWQALFGVLAWALLVLVSAEFVRSRAERTAAARATRAETARRRAHEERLRIARELHDTVAHHMSLISVQAGVALHIGERHPEQLRSALTAIKDASKEGLGELRALVDLLREEGEAPRQPTATLEALDELVERTRATGLDVVLTVEGRRRPVPTAVELAAYRIVQEAVTNVVRHSQAESLRIALGYGDDELTVQVDDDGRGGTVSADRAGSGITGMRERVAALDGTISIGPGAAGGFRVRATLPTSVGA